MNWLIKRTLQHVQKITLVHRNGGGGRRMSLITMMVRTQCSSDKMYMHLYDILIGLC